MDPGTYIAIAEVAFRGAAFAVRVFRNGLNFSSDAERLVLRLEVERFRLQIWGENSGIVPMPGSGARPTLSPRLEPLCDILRHQLDEIAGLFREHEALSNRYGLAQTDEAPTRSARVAGLVARMQKSFRSGNGSNALLARQDANVDQDAQLAEELRWLEIHQPRQDNPARPQITTGFWNRVRWSILDLKKFEALVSDLSSRVSALNQLLAEVAQQRRAHEDDVRVSIVVVGSAVDDESLRLVHAAVSGKNDAVAQTARLGIERKALTAGGGLPLAPVVQTPPRLADYVLPEGFETMGRFLAPRRSGGADELFLFERKSFDKDIGFQDKRRLTDRIQRLVMLLSRPKGTVFLTPEAEGCIHDPERYCWWLVFRFPVQPSLTPVSGNRDKQQQHHHQPVSLRSLLDPKLKFRPALEQRYVLASVIAGTLSELYSSSWLHKGIRSDNILFRVQPSTLPSAETLRAPMLCGFDYSRQESEWATIDKARTSGTVATALYRHPAYQGDAAQGYCIEFDLYSLGLVLVEIALWMPLASFLEARPVAGGKSGSGGGGEVVLSRDIKVFHEPHARVLNKLVTRQVDSEMAFRVGGAYYAAVKFCLEAAERRGRGAGEDGGVEVIGEGEVSVHPALEFYNSVVVPLARLAGV